MDWLINIFYYLVPFLVLLGILVFVHELGHFAIARLCGVKVEEFSIGFGREIWGFNDKHGTRWKIAMIPLGGFVKMLGDADASSATAGEEAKELSEAEKKQSFTFQPPSKKLAIAVAGPAANYVFAILIFTGIFYFMGKMTFPPVIGEVVAGGAAEQAGMKVNDRVLKINGKDVESFTDLQREVDLITDGKAKLEIERDGKVLPLNLTLKEIEIDGADGKKVKKAMLGVRSVNVVEVQKEDLSLWQALKNASDEAWTVTESTLRGVGQMLTGRRNADDVGGVIRIAEMTGDISKQHSLMSFLVFMALLSINLGLINLFPIPVLDGGQVVICLIEIITRREMNEKVKEYMFRLGLALTLALWVFATWNDLTHLFDRLFVKD